MGSNPSRAPSIAGRTRSKNAINSVFIFGLERKRTRVARAVFQQDLDAPLSLSELGVAKSRELDSFFKVLEGRIERQIPALELLDDFLEPLQGGLEIRRWRWICCFSH